MDIKEFANEISEGVKDKAGDGFHVKVTEDRKNNGVIHTAISVFPTEGKVGAGISLDGCYGEYKKGVIGIGEITEAVYTLLMEHKDDLGGVDTASIFEWGRAKGCIYAKLVNAEMNKGILAGIPHRKFLDLAVAYYGVVDVPGNGRAGSFLVQDKHMELWGQDEESLYRTALGNMRAKGRPVFEDMESVLSACLPEEMQPFPIKEPGISMYVLTNRDKLFGAAEILDGDTLRGIGDKLGGDFIVLPSSVHETLIILSDKEDAYQGYADIVRDVNRGQVLMEERLSDHVYLYDRREGTLKIAA